MRKFWLVACLSVLPACIAEEPLPGELYRDARAAERKGDIVSAYLLYSQAAALEPGNKEYWGRSQALRTRAALLAKVKPANLDASQPDLPSDDPDLPPVVSLTKEELKSAQEFADVPELTLPLGTKAFHFRGPAKNLFEQIAPELGFDVIFDRDYGSTDPVSLQLDDVSARDLLRAAEAATGSFLVPITGKVVLVAKDTPQKRQELETNVAVTIPLPEPVGLPEAQEVARDVQQTFDLRRVALDGVRRLAFLRGPVSQVRPAQLLFTQLLAHRPQVEVELEFVDIESSSSSSWGLNLPTSLPLVSFGGPTGSNAFPRLLQIAAIPAGFTRFLAFGGGASFLGLGLTDSQLFASATQSRSQTLLRTQIRSVEGQPATLHIGDRFPIQTAVYSVQAPSDSTGQVYTPPPSFQYEDLGLNVKVTPRVHGMDEVSLDVEAEFKVLGGAGLNGIPIISSRKFNSKIRLRNGEWGVVAGLMSASEARTLSGLAGLSQIPLLGPLVRSNTKDHSRSEVLLVLKPRLISLPPTEVETKQLWIGTESRPLTPL